MGRLIARGWSVAVAESLTGGLVVSSLVSVPGASAAVRGGIVAYATPLKHTLLGVDAALLAAEGAVHPDVARQMAAGVRE
ncbi:MAG: nicotinamide-nucleotide amidohydrolase family protein, partial [Microbacterium sp.]